MEKNYPQPLKLARIAPSAALRDPTLLRIRSVRPATDTQTGVRYTTFSIDANGGAGGSLMIDINQVVDGVTTTTEIDGGTYTTLGALVTALNAIDGIECTRNAALAALDTDTAYFVDVAATWLPENVWTKTLTNSLEAGSIEPDFVRLDNYQHGKAGLINIHKILTQVTFGAGACRVVVRDLDGNLLDFGAALTTNTLETLDWMSAPRLYRGPILVGYETTTNYVSTITQFDVMYSFVRL